ncbi:MAG: hypothetical protein WB817_09770 [Terriglobales bacterium]
MTETRELPAAVRAIAALFALSGLYLAILAVITLASPGTIPMSAAAPLLFGLELAGPYMFLLMAVAAGAVAWGLFKRNNITRHVAMLIAITGIVMLVPPVSDATVTGNLKLLAASGAGIIIRVIVAWNLGRSETAEQFRRP